MINTSGYDNVYKALREHLETHSIYTPIIKQTPTGEEYPLVVVEEIENSTIARTIYGFDSISLIGIEIEINAKEKTVGLKKVSGRTIATELKCLVDEVCTDMYGMKRVNVKPTPNVDNSTMYRIVMRYNAKQNDRRSVFY